MLEDLVWVTDGEGGVWVQEGRLRPGSQRGMVVDC
jgi:hypothetical protein